MYECLYVCEYERVIKSTFNIVLITKSNETCQQRTIDKHNGYIGYPTVLMVLTICILKWDRKKYIEALFQSKSGRLAIVPRNFKKKCATN